MGYVAELQQFDTQPAAEPDPEPTDPYAALADLAPRDVEPPGRSADAPPAGHLPAPREPAAGGQGRPGSGTAARIRNAWALPEPGAEPEAPHGRSAVPEPRHAEGPRQAGGTLLSGGTGRFARISGAPPAPGAHDTAWPGTTGPDWRQTDQYVPSQHQADQYEPARYQAEQYEPARYQADQYEPARYQAEQYEPARYQAEQYEPARYQAEQYEPSRHQAEQYEPGWGPAEQNGPGWGRAAGANEPGWPSPPAATGPAWFPESSSAAAGWAPATEPGVSWAPAVEPAGAGNGPAAWHHADAAPATGGNAGTDGDWTRPVATPAAHDREVTVTADHRHSAAPADRRGGTAGHRVPESAAAPRPQRRRMLVLGAAATAVLLGTGICYAALRGSAPTARTAAPAATATGLPSDDVQLDPAAATPAGIPAQPAESPKPSTSSPAGATPTASRRSGHTGGSSPTGTTAPTGPGTALPGAATPGSGTPKPSATASPSTSASPSPSAPPLTAAFSHTADSGPDGLTNYAGTVRVTNPRDRAASQWKVTLKIPGGNQVSGDSAVSVTQDGEKVTFTPVGDAATIPAGGSVTFTFTVQGVLTADPGSCMINGQSCG
ncbi:hypothetical protein KRMM14A1259_21520 [Krasilnikovia sp. MM14-A1259]